MEVNGREISDCVVHMPEDVEFTTSDNVFVKGMVMVKKGTLVAQHSHKYAHASLVAKGSVRVWQNGETFAKDYIAPAMIEIPALVKHKFLSLEDDTMVYCIHNIDRGGPVVHEENSVEQ